GIRDFHVTGVQTCALPISTPRFDRQVLQELLRFGFPLQLNFVLSFVFSRADTFLISVLLGPAQVAFYEIARRIPDSVSDAYEAFVQVYFPSVAQRIEKIGRAH